MDDKIFGADFSKLKKGLWDDIDKICDNGKQENTMLTIEMNIPSPEEQMISGTKQALYSFVSRVSLGGDNATKAETIILPRIVELIKELDKSEAELKSSKEEPACSVHEDEYFDDMIVRVNEKLRQTYFDFILRVCSGNIQNKKELELLPLIIKEFRATESALH